VSTLRNVTNDDNNHREVWELLPWYANGTLGPEEANKVEYHLAHCTPCQNELTRCEAEYGAVSVRRDDLWAPTREHFAKVLASVDAFEARRAVRPNWLDTLASYFPWLKSTPQPARWALAFQGALVAALAAVLMLRALAPVDTYQTLSRPGEERAAHGPQLRLVFHPDVTERELRTLLGDLHASIVQGPSSVGAYTVELGSGASQAQLKQALAKLRADPSVRLAEPVLSQAR
jgi:anti-sigma factor RsiW